VNAVIINHARLARKSTRSFNSVLLYEDSNSGERAWEFYEKLSRKFQGDFEFRHLMWSFSVLRDSQTLRLAVKSAADANLIILSLSGHAGLPPSVKNWVQRWSSLARGRNAAVVSLLDDNKNADATAEMHAYLRQLLGSRKIDFFPHSPSVSCVSHLE
jgi:hypothetical protein